MKLYSLVVLLIAQAALNAAQPDDDLVRSGWQRYYRKLCRLHVNSRSVLDTLGPLAAHNHTLSRSQAERSIVYLGHNTRLRRVVAKLLRSVTAVQQTKPSFHVAAWGGALTCGDGASRKGQTDWVSSATAALKRSFLTVDINTTRRCVPLGVSALTTAVCSHKLGSLGAELLLLELVHSEAPDPAYVQSTALAMVEKGLRALLLQPQRPAVVMVQVPAIGQAYPPGKPGAQPFHQTAEDMYGSVAQYYGIPWLSLRDALWVDAERRVGALTQGWASVMDTSLDNTNDLGHSMIADMVVWLLQRTALDLLMTPVSKAEEDRVSGPLPVPMIQGNYEDKYPMPCSMV